MQTIKHFHCTHLHCKFQWNGFTLLKSEEAVSVRFEGNSLEVPVYVQGTLCLSTNRIFTREQNLRSHVFHSLWSRQELFQSLVNAVL